MKDFLTYREAAYEMGKSVESVQKAVSNGILQPVWIRKQGKFIARDEVLWFKDKPLTLVNAELYQKFKALGPSPVPQPPSEHSYEWFNFAFTEQQLARMLGE